MFNHDSKVLTLSNAKYHLDAFLKLQQPNLSVVSRLSAELQELVNAIRSKVTRVGLVNHSLVNVQKRFASALESGSSNQALISFMNSRP